MTIIKSTNTIKNTYSQEYKHNQEYISSFDALHASLQVQGVSTHNTYINIQT